MLLTNTLIDVPDPLWVRVLGTLQVQMPFLIWSDFFCVVHRAGVSEAR